MSFIDQSIVKKELISEWRRGDHDRRGVDLVWPLHFV